MSPILAAGSLHTSTVLLPSTIKSGGPTQMHWSVMRACGRAPVRTVTAPVITGPPTCGIGGRPGVAMGQRCMSVMRDAGGPGMSCRFRGNAAGAAVGDIARGPEEARKAGIGEFWPEPDRGEDHGACDGDAGEVVCGRNHGLALRRHASAAPEGADGGPGLGTPEVGPLGRFPGCASEIVVLRLANPRFRREQRRMRGLRQ